MNFKTTQFFTFLYYSAIILLSNAGFVLLNTSTLSPNKDTKNKESLFTHSTEKERHVSLAQVNIRNKVASLLKKKTNDNPAAYRYPTSSNGSSNSNTVVNPTASTNTNNSNVSSTNTVININQNADALNNYVNENEYNKFYFARFIQCNPNTCKSPPNQCVDANTCRCGPGYANLDNYSTREYCTYEQKKQLTAFLLELFLGMGIGHLYCIRIWKGILKMILGLLPCVLICVVNMKHLSFKMDPSSTPGTRIILYTMILSCCVYVVWEIVDIFMFGFNKYNDGFGVPLFPWIQH